MSDFWSSADGMTAMQNDIESRSGNAEPVEYIGRHRRPQNSYVIPTVVFGMWALFVIAAYMGWIGE
jgi:hypothetical protein